MNKKKLVIFLLATLIIVLPSVFAEFETYGYVRHSIDNSNSSNAVLERSGFVLYQRESTVIQLKHISFYYSVGGIAEFNNQTIPEFGDADIEKITVRCEKWSALEDLIATSPESLNMDAWANASYHLLLDKTYDESDPADNQLEEFSILSDDLIKCTTKTYYTDLIGVPQRLDILEPVSFSFILPNYDTKVCQDFNIKNTWYSQLESFVLSIMRIDIELLATVYWLFKIIIYVGILCLTVYIVVWFYLFLKGLMGKLD
jgi:hypothetical protein